MWKGAVLAAMCGAIAWAQAPKVLRATLNADYSEQARMARLQGTVLLSATIGPDGRAHNIAVLNSLGLGLDESAVAAAAIRQFTPRPSPVELELEVNFRLPADEAGWSMSRAKFSVPEGASQPVLRKASFTSTTVPALRSPVRVAFDIDPQGVPANIQVEISPDPKMDDEVIAMIREWRFEAALRDGSAVVAHAVFDLSAGLNPRAPGALQIAPRKKQ